jgi:hypothetical protein
MNMQQERIFRPKLLPWCAKGHKWGIEEKTFTEKMRHEWVLIASQIPSEQKAKEIIEIYKK